MKKKRRLLLFQNKWQQSSNPNKNKFALLATLVRPHFLPFTDFPAGRLSMPLSLRASLWYAMEDNNSAVFPICHLLQYWQPFMVFTLACGWEQDALLNGWIAVGLVSFHTCDCSNTGARLILCKFMDQGLNL